MQLAYANYITVSTNNALARTIRAAGSAASNALALVCESDMQQVSEVPRANSAMLRISLTAADGPRDQILLNKTIDQPRKLGSPFAKLDAFAPIDVFELHVASSTKKHCSQAVATYHVVGRWEA